MLRLIAAIAVGIVLGLFLWTHVSFGAVNKPIVAPGYALPPAVKIQGVVCYRNPIMHCVMRVSIKPAVARGLLSASPSFGDRFQSAFNHEALVNGWGRKITRIACKPSKAISGYFACRIKLLIADKTTVCGVIETDRLIGPPTVNHKTPCKGLFPEVAA